MYDNEHDIIAVNGCLTLPQALSGHVDGLYPMPRSITLFSAGHLAGATNLKEWSLKAPNGARYKAYVENSTVKAVWVPVGTIIVIK